MTPYQITNHYKRKAFYQEFGRIVSQSGLAKTQLLEAVNRNGCSMLGFYAYHCHDSIIGDDEKYLSQMDIK